MSAIVTQNQNRQPYVRFVWHIKEGATWGIAAGGTEFIFVDTNLVVGEWRPGIYVWLEK